ncbi:MAG: RNA 2',3'-cyclic phosphodiesterase [Chitinispirillaceae bacterium]|nr:RNA 2',3'-cyclic phosphodiesterase [Chitinispirillaceae bacterium]
MPRLFIAIDFPERIIDDIMDTYMAIPGARWEPREQLHLTLRFIGEVPGDTFTRVEHALRSVRGPSFSLAVKSVGFFPLRGIPEILWAGISENEELLRLQARIERAVIGAGIEPDRRKFHPHITLARLHETSPAKTAQFITAHSLFMTETFEVSGFQLYSSVLLKEGAHHTVEERFRLVSRHKFPA